LLSTGTKFIREYATTSRDSLGIGYKGEHEQRDEKMGALLHLYFFE